MKRFTKETFNNKLLENNSNYILYGDYIDYNKKCLFFCKVHCDTFEAKPSSIVKGIVKCSKCVLDARLNVFLNKAIENDIKYVLVGDFMGGDIETDFYCKIHDYVFKTTPNRILFKNTGCPLCSGVVNWTHDILNEHLKKQNRQLYFCDYIEVRHHTKCICLNCGYGSEGEWTPTPKNILAGRGCPNCCPKGFVNRSEKPTFFYYIKIKNKSIWKVGITEKTVQKRFESDFKLMDLLFTVKFERGIDAWEFEQNIINKNLEYRYSGEKILKYGNKELFIKDVFDGNYNLINFDNYITRPTLMEIKIE